MPDHSAQAFEVLFQTPADGEGSVDPNHRGVRRYRTKTIRAGDQVECELFPIWPTRGEVGRAKAEKQKQRAAQAELNERNAVKRVIRRANASFTARDLFVTLTYAGAPPDEARARRDMQRYIKDVRQWRRKRGLPEMQYIYAIEFDDGAGTRKRIHLHVMMTGMDRDAAEALWTRGRANCRRLQPDARGFEGVVRYMCKAKRRTRRIACSRNITEPKITTADRKISPKKVERMAQGLPEVARSVFERAYPGYAFVDVEIRTSEFVPGAYVYAKLWRKERRDAHGGAKAAGDVPAVRAAI